MHYYTSVSTYTRHLKCLITVTPEIYDWKQKLKKTVGLHDPEYAP